MHPDSDADHPDQYADEYADEYADDHHDVHAASGRSDSLVPDDGPARIDARGSGTLPRAPSIARRFQTRSTIRDPKGSRIFLRRFHLRDSSRRKAA
jgi:hypothetical protein